MGDGGGAAATPTPSLAAGPPPLGAVVVFVTCCMGFIVGNGPLMIPNRSLSMKFTDQVGKVAVLLSSCILLVTRSHHFAERCCFLKTGFSSLYQSLLTVWLSASNVMGPLWAGFALNHWTPLVMVFGMLAINVAVTLYWLSFYRCRPCGRCDERRGKRTASAWCSFFVGWCAEA